VKPLGLMMGLFLFFAAGCENSPNKPDEKSPGFAVIVKDENGQKLENVGIHFLLFEWPWGRHASIPEKKTLHKVEAGSFKVPTEYALYQNYPNPFNPLTSITYELPVLSQMKLSILNYPGNDTLVTLIQGLYQAGHYKVMWDGRNGDAELLTNGLYKYAMEAPGFTDSKILCINMRDPEMIAQSKARFYTGKNGFVQIDCKDILVGKEVPYTDENSPEVLGIWVVPDSITVAMAKTGYETLLKKVCIDTTRYVEHQFVLKKK
jgi:hypothetical protein